MGASSRSTPSVREIGGRSFAGRFAFSRSRCAVERLKLCHGQRGPRLACARAWHIRCSSAGMAHHRRGDQRALRRPFVVTVVTLAVSPLGCGGAVTGGPGDTGGGAAGGSTTTGSTSETTGTTTGSSTTDGVGGGSAVTVGTSGGGSATTGAGGSSGGAGGSTPTACPLVHPFSGAACYTEGQRCSYPFCPMPATADCVAGRWQVQTSPCNPPPPDSGACPVVEPAVGTACGLGGRCAYPVKCCGVVIASRTYSCSGVWRLESQDGGFCSGPAEPVQALTDSGRPPCEIFDGAAPDAARPDAAPPDAGPRDAVVPDSFFGPDE
jgi:hypothetical protein